MTETSADHCAQLTYAFKLPCGNWRVYICWQRRLQNVGWEWSYDAIRPANHGSDGMSKVVCVASAKVPIVKVWDPELELACDMNVNNTLALENTRMIKTYVQIDERVRPLTMIIKHWTKRRILNDAGMSYKTRSVTSCLPLRSPGWNPQLIHLDLYRVEFPSNKRSSDPTLAPHDAFRETPDRDWRGVWIL